MRASERYPGCPVHPGAELDYLGFNPGREAHSFVCAVDGCGQIVEWPASYVDAQSVQHIRERNADVGHAPDGGPRGPESESIMGATYAEEIR